MVTNFINIKQLLQVRTTSVDFICGNDMKNLPLLENAFLTIEKDIIVDFGTMDDFNPIKNSKIVNCIGKVILPSWCDSHTHLVFADNREQEFVDRINGLTYEEIANRGGGILNSVKKLRETSEEDLYQQSAKRLQEVIELGTGAIEIKSGYGLTLESELKMLRIIKRLSEKFPISIKKTFLGAHAFPTEFKKNQDAYIDLICNEMLPTIAAENLADYVDVFCEKGYFSLQQMERILVKAAQYNLKPKVHVNQFNSFGAVALAVKNNAKSVDHLEILNIEDIVSLKNSQTMPVALPTCSFFLGIPYTPAKEILKAGLPLALASDYNPGSTPSGNMNFVISLACIKLKMTPEEAINAATINAAFAMDLHKSHGSITIGKKANLIITKPITSFYELPYLFGTNLIESVLLNGQYVS